ncbi:hypothetical protein TNCV_554211 [Trichonephila clavipes]|nr:hypothetical protein TNCV_554211 [Trichonephila clavipes]
MTRQGADRSLRGLQFQVDRSLKIVTYQLIQQFLRILRWQHSSTNSGSQVDYKCSVEFMSGEQEELLGKTVERPLTSNKQTRRGPASLRINEKEGGLRTEKPRASDRMVEIEKASENQHFGVELPNRDIF